MTPTATLPTAPAETARRGRQDAGLAIETRGLTKRYSDRTAVDGLTCGCAAGR